MRPLVVLALLVALPGAAVLGQWHVGLEFGSTRYGGSARDTSNGSGPSTFRPGAAPVIGLRVERMMGRLGAALRVSYAKPGLAVEGDDLAVVDKSSGELFEVATPVAARVGGIGPSGAIRAELGPALHLWKFGDDIHSRLGALGAMAYEWPVAGRFSGAIRVEGVVSRSWFEDGDLPPEYDLRPTLRYGVTLGVRYRL